MALKPWLCGLLLLVCTGCFGPKFIANNMIGSMKDMKQSFFAEANPDHGFYAGPALLAQLDGFIFSSPQNADLLVMGAEMNCGYAMTFLDTRDAEWAASQYRKGTAYGMRALKEKNEAIHDALSRGDEEALAKELAKVDEDDLPFVFWTGMCWGGLINITQDATLAADLPLTVALIERSLEIDPGHYFAGGHLFLGMLYGGRAAMFGGDLAKGKKHYEKAIELTGGKFVLARVHYAKFYAVTAQDPELYLQILNEVVSEDVHWPPEMRLANAVWRAEARKLLDKVGDFFPAWQPPEEVEEDVAPLEEDDEELDLD